ncbi:MAG: DUF4868 domain-containing protein [Ruminobacter sp.]|uniref:Kiwa anti-phage protein KwaB-like domain-containing protein n=1 Tax=Ruminobacter sp. TaxID=2774296 RepID=UPI001B4802C9|nr:Kiwa anti-phage protein KwaB-like domain-containing protein [Ruminobacter sp.]MBP3748404.1 DUF4868 domain-containing protein [Ruminobacter sp.]
MSLEKIRTMFKALSSSKAWSLQLLGIKTSKCNGTSYIGREITLSPKGRLTKFVEEISDYYINESKGVLLSYSDVRDYDGSTVDKLIYRLSKSDKLIASEYETLIDEISFPDVEINPLEFKAQAYVLKGKINDDRPVILISMHNPVTTLKHKFWSVNGSFEEIPNKVINLRTSIDVVIMDDTVYMLTLAGENLFNMERAYRNICEAKVKEIEDLNIVNNFKAFSSAAKKGQNPRKFVSFNDAHLQKLKDPANRIKMGGIFKIRMEEDLFDTSDSENSDKIVKLICNRGMLDPFDENPMEVDGSKIWK